MTKEGSGPIFSPDQMAIFKAYARIAVLPPFGGPWPYLIPMMRRKAVEEYVASAFQRTGHLPCGRHQVLVPGALSNGPAYYNIATHTIAVVFPADGEWPP